MYLVVRTDEGVLRLQCVREGGHVEHHDVGGLLHLLAVEQSVHQPHGRVTLGVEVMNSATERAEEGEEMISAMASTVLSSDDNQAVGSIDCEPPNAGSNRSLGLCPRPAK